MQEIGPMRMNKIMLDEVYKAYPNMLKDSEMWTLNKNDTDAGHILAGKTFALGLKHYGFLGMMHYHRGGESRYYGYIGKDNNNKPVAPLSSKDQEDTNKLIYAYQVIQKTLIQNGWVQTSGNDMAWTEGPDRLCGQGYHCVIA